jgi:phage terminase large subunit GpA-like protein
MRLRRLRRPPDRRGLRVLPEPRGAERLPDQGPAGAGHPIAGKPTLNKLRAPLYHVGVDAAKGALFSRLQLGEPGPGYCHFPREAGRGYDGEFFRGLVSEKRKTRVRAGRKETTWVQSYSRNEPLDCRVYATAALELLLLSTPNLLERLAAEEEKRRQVAGTPARPTVAARPMGRRVISRGVQ